MRHLDKNDILTDAQHGFRKRCSCETQLLLSSNDFLKSLDSNTQTDAILLDFAKAFDKVAHQRPPPEAPSYWYWRVHLRWIRSFLSQRDQTVVLEGSSSDNKPVTSGVPQGTVLGITRKKSPVKASYVIHGHTLAETDTAKYLGVSLHKHSSCSPHVNATAKKANGTRQLEPSSSATYARRQLQWRCAHTNPSSAQSLNTPVWYGTPTQLKT